MGIGPILPHLQLRNVFEIFKMLINKAKIVKFLCEFEAKILDQKFENIFA